MASPVLEVWFEFGSTYSHIAVHRVEAMANGSGVRVAWRPFLLGPIFKQQGWPDSPFNLYPTKGTYMWRDMERLCEKHRIPFRRPSQFPRNGLLSARVALVAEHEEWLGRFIRAVFQANFWHDLDISEAELVHKLIERAGCAEAEAVLERAASADTKRLLRERTDRAGALGIFGAPSFMVGDELFWGNDRMEDALLWCRRTGRHVHV